MNPHHDQSPVSSRHLYAVPADGQVMILSIANESVIPSATTLALRSRLPQGFLLEVDKYYRWQDRQAALLGKSLVRIVLNASGFDIRMLDLWSVDDYSRPTLPVPFDFNISHCPGMVVCAFGIPGPVGIDIEPLRPVRAYDFRSVLTPTELALLEKLPDGERQRLFGCIWTRKEAAIKADGKGFSNTLTQVSALESSIFLDGNRWEITPISMPAPYICHLATHNTPPGIHHWHLTLEQLAEP